MSVITIIGAGMMGSALSFPSADNKHDIRIVGTPLDKDIIEQAKLTGYHITLKRYLPKGIEFYNTDEMEEAIKGSDLIIGGVSSFGVDWFLKEVLPKIPNHIPVLSVTKGMIDLGDGNMLTYPEYYEKHTNSYKSLNAIGGACTSYELADRDNTHVCFCGSDINILRKLKKMLETDYYHISISEDIRGVESAVALKNIYALAVTLAVGISEKKDGKGVIHYNSQAALFGQSVREMMKLIKILGGNEENIVFGAGDLYVTVFGGRTRKIGTLLGAGLDIDEALDTLKGVTLESVVIASRAASAVRELIRRNKIDKKDFPLLLHVDDIITNKAMVDIPWEKFEIEKEL
ncbi:NAD(P)H-dependent glycerol-3-phosphate dehydrogenase [Anaerofustis stercorihominis]|uniref:NAD(P)H-dependent glycerol-3-phosphate dehydrogenase n=1 Tax=Anaerofustis stercorihominis TaxID=214853 RepID=UPI00214B3F7E|nr:glycerol-3-phosphate dehydrogenase [Anaerofustis stercorihominis]MCR2033617.1 glycerol-3-phosphate dehydrogenase [Anaerofustis stercorihominis]